MNSFQMPVPPVRCGWLLAMTDIVIHKQAKQQANTKKLHLFLSHKTIYNGGMTKSDTPAKKPRQPNARGPGRESMSGAGKSPVVTLRLPVALAAKMKERGGSAWVRGLIEAA